MPNSKSHDRLARESQPRTSIRVGWFSTWNSRCGIAEYSKNLLNGFDTERFNWTVLASQNDLLVVPDNGRVIRCWTNSAGSAGHLLAILLREPFDVLVIQFKLQADFGFLSLLHLEAVIACCHCAGTRVFLILHATDGLAPGGETMSLPRIAQSLSTVERILVHSYTDLERLRACGVQDNIELFPHGFIDLAPYDTKELRQAQQLPENAIIIGSHGFLLPHKGIDELIKALALLRDSGTRAKLLLANAVYPIPASEEQLALCRSIAADYQVTDDIIFETRFLPAEDSLKLLAACDVIVYPYQHSVEIGFWCCAPRTSLPAPGHVFALTDFFRCIGNRVLSPRPSGQRYLYGFAEFSVGWSATRAPAPAPGRMGRTALLASPRPTLDG